MGGRVGIDLVAESTVAAALARDHERYVARVFTDAEARECHVAAGPDPRKLAQRFAAKEAVYKVLRPGDDAVPWPAIEVLEAAPGGWLVRLSGRAQELARAADLASIDVSISRVGGYVCAVATAGS